MLESKRFASTEDWLEYRVERVHYQEKIELLELQLKKEQEESNRLKRWLNISTRLWQAGVVFLFLLFLCLYE